MRVLNIVFLDFDDIKNPLLGAGQARATFEVGKRLAQRGHSVKVYCSKYPNSKDRIEEGIEYKHIGIGSTNIKLNNAAYILSIPFLVRNIKADIIVECFTAPISTLFSPIFTSIPVVALPSIFAAREYSKKYHLPFNVIEKIGCRFYKYFLPYSEVSFNKMKALNPQVNYKIIPQGVDKSFFSIKKKQAKHILFLGRLDLSQKGIDLLLKSWAKIQNDVNYPLVIAGHGPDERKIKNLIKELGVEDTVKLIGPCYGKKKEQTISESLFTVFPSRHDEMSLWVLESLASGLPLAAFDTPDLSWAPEEVALKARSFDIDDYSKIIKKLANKKLLKELSENTRTFAKKYTWENVASQFESFFQEILKIEASKVEKNNETNRKFGVKRIWQNLSIKTNNS